MKLQILKTSVPMAHHTVPMQVPGTERIRGSALQRIRQRILRRDGGICRCALCQRTRELKEAAEVEHRTPLWAGGQEDDANRYAIAQDCHEAKTRCEARMRAAGGWLSTPCSCGRHGMIPTAQEGAGDALPGGMSEASRAEIEAPAGP